MASPPAIQIFSGTGGSPNTAVVSEFLDKIKEHYPGTVDYEFMIIDLSKKTHQEPWYLKFNPNGRVPAIVDRSRGEFAVIESSAILLYLAQIYDKDYVFWFNPQENVVEHSEMLQWIFWTHGGLAPMLGEWNYYARKASEKIPFAQNRYLDEVKRLFGVLEIRLAGRDYLAGTGKGKYSLADLKTVPWVALHSYISIETLGEWPNLKAWFERCSSS